MKDLTTSYPQPDHDGQFIIQQSTIEVKNDPAEDPPQSLWHKNLEVHHLILKVQFLFFRVWSQRGKDGCRSCERESSLGLSEEAHGAQGGCWLDNDFLFVLKWIPQRLMHDWRIWGTNWRIWQQPMQSPRMISRWYYEISINDQNYALRDSRLFKVWVRLLVRCSGSSLRRSSLSRWKFIKLTLK